MFHVSKRRASKNVRSHPLYICYFQNVVTPCILFFPHSYFFLIHIIFFSVHYGCHGTKYDSTLEFERKLGARKNYLKSGKYQ